MHENQNNRRFCHATYNVSYKCPQCPACHCTGKEQVELSSLRTGAAWPREVRPVSQNDSERPLGGGEEGRTLLPVPGPPSGSKLSEPKMPVVQMIATTPLYIWQKGTNHQGLTRLGYLPMLNRSSLQLPWGAGLKLLPLNQAKTQNWASRLRGIATTRWLSITVTSIRLLWSRQLVQKESVWCGCCLMEDPTPRT